MTVDQVRKTEEHVNEMASQNATIYAKEAELSVAKSIQGLRAMFDEVRKNKHIKERDKFWKLRLGEMDLNVCFHSVATGDLESNSLSIIVQCSANREFIFTRVQVHLVNC